MAEYKSLKHESTVIVVKSKPELMYVLTWCTQNGLKAEDFMYSISFFPYCLSVASKIVGWTDSMDRALYYKPFEEFLQDINQN